MPIPVEDIIHAHDAVGAWTAELDGRPIGHVCRVRSPRGSAAADTLNTVCAQAHGCDPSRLAWVSALFVATEGRGLSIGRRLMEEVVADAREHSLHPCLEVMPVHAGAMSLYLGTGWRTVHRLRYDWLQDAVGAADPDVHVMVLAEQPGAEARPG